jgi:hypothetical protein
LLPVLGREVIKHQQTGFVLNELVYRLLIYGTVSGDGSVEGSDGIGSSGTYEAILHGRPGFGLLGCRQGVQHMSHLVEPSMLRSGCPTHFLQCTQKPMAPVASA